MISTRNSGEPNIKITRKPSDKNPSDLLTEEEIFKMIEVADNDRDKAIIAVLHESGCRERTCLITIETHKILDFLISSGIAKTYH